MSAAGNPWVPAQPASTSAMLLVLRVTLGLGLAIAGWGKLGPQFGICNEPMVVDCEAEQREACGGDAICEGLVPARCKDERRAACREKAESAKRYFGGLRLFGPEGTELPGGGELNLLACGVVELLGGLLLALGLLARPTAIPVAFTMAVAMASAHWGSVGISGAFLSEPAFLYLLLATTVLVSGPGAWSIDAQLRRNGAPRPKSGSKK